MSTILIYFSGRGNALNAARMIANKMGDTQLIPVYDVLNKKIQISAERIGFVFPVIDLGVPRIITQLIRHLDFANQKKYCFAVVTTGGMPAGTLYQLQNRLKDKGLKLSAGFYLISNGKQESLDTWDAKTDEIASIVQAKGEKKLDKVGFVGRYIMTGVGNRIARAMIPYEDKKFRLRDNCDGCGVCQRVCPVKNIEMKNGIPNWLHKCEQCGACFNFCPPKALHGTNLAAHTYHINPYVNVHDFLIDEN